MSLHTFTADFKTYGLVLEHYQKKTLKLLPQATLKKAEAFFSKLVQDIHSLLVASVDTRQQSFLKQLEYFEYKISVGLVKSDFYIKRIARIRSFVSKKEEVPFFDADWLAEKFNSWIVDEFEERVKDHYFPYHSPDFPLTSFASK